MDMPASDALSAQLQSLAALDRNGLVREWQATFGTPVPKSLQSGLLSRLIAWQIQMNRLAQGRAGHTAKDTALSIPSASTLTRRLQRSARQGASPVLAPGSRLVREWQGTTHHVLVVEGGYEHRGTRYRSLTAIAKAITGTSWSGPAFFGLNR